MPSASRRRPASSTRTTRACPFGGPILKDRLWFYGSYRTLDTQTAVEGVVANANAGLAPRWDWLPSAINSRLVQDRQMAIGRFAGQASKSRIQVNYEYQHRCEGTPLTVEGKGCHNRGDDWVGLGTTTQSPESTQSAGRGYFDWPFHLTQGQWTMPATSKLLFEADMTIFRYNPAFGYPPPDGITNLIPVTEQSSALALQRQRHACVSGVGGLHAGKRGDTALGAGDQLPLPRDRSVGPRGGRHQQLYRQRGVRHRFAQHEGGLPVLLAATAR